MSSHQIGGHRLPKKKPLHHYVSLISNAMWTINLEIADSALDVKRRQMKRNICEKRRGKERRKRKRIRLVQNRVCEKG